MKLKVENAKLSRRVDSIKNENQNISWIEQEKDSLKQNVAQMKATIENLQKSQSKQVRSLHLNAVSHRHRWSRAMAGHTSFYCRYLIIHRPTPTIHVVNRACIARRGH